MKSLLTWTVLGIVDFCIMVCVIILWTSARDVYMTWLKTDSSGADTFIIRSFFET